MKRCRKCGKLIKFIRMMSGKWEPCDPALARPDGELQLVFSDGTVGKHHARLDFGFISHFATCPDAEFFKRKKSRSKELAKKTAGDLGKLFD